MVNPKKGDKWVLVLRKKDQKLSVLAKSSVRISLKNGEEGKWASKWWPVKIIDKGNDKTHLLSLRVDPDGKIINSGIQEETKISRVDIDKRADAIIVNQPSIFDESAGSSGVGNTKNLRNLRSRVKRDQLIENDEGSTITVGDDEETSGEDSSDEESDSNEDEEDRSAHEDDGEDEWNNKTSPKTTPNRTKSPELQENCPFCSPEFEVTTEIASFVGHLANYLNCRYRRQTAAKIDDRSSLGVRADLSNTKSISMSNKRGSSKSSIIKDSISPNSKLEIDGSVVELMEGSGVYINAADKKLFERKYLKKPGKLTTELFKSILGDNLSNMSLAGNCGHERIPNDVRETVHSYVMTHKKKKKYNDEKFENDVRKMCSYIRAAKKKAEGTEIERKSIARKKKSQGKQSLGQESQQETRDSSSVAIGVDQTSSKPIIADSQGVTSVNSDHNSEQKSQNDPLPQENSSSSTRSPSVRIEVPPLNAENCKLSSPKSGEAAEPQGGINMLGSQRNVNDDMGHHPEALGQHGNLLQSMMVDSEVTQTEDSLIDGNKKKVETPHLEGPAEQPIIDANVNNMNTENERNQTLRPSSRSESVSSTESRRESKSKRKHHKHRSKGHRRKSHGKREEKRHHHHARRHERRESNDRHERHKRKGRSSSSGSERHKRRR